MKRIYHIATLLLGTFLLGAFTTSWLSDEITAEDVLGFTNITGLQFTEAEIDSLLPGLDEFRSDYEKLREYEIDNSIAPVLEFNPFPAGYHPPQASSGIDLEPVRATLPANREDLAWYSIRQLAYLLRSGQLSSVELTRFSLDRLKRYNPQLQCVISLTEERALRMAQQADRELAAGTDRGLLHGIPYGAKDLLAVEGYPTTWGATPYKEQSFDYDAAVIRQLDEAGAVLVAKLTLGALAWGDVWFGGMTRNPWDTETGSSGSSAGSASAVAAGLVPFAIGTETLGSIVSPSTVCGTTGLRPTFGRVSRDGAMALVWSMDKIGPITRSSEDALLVLNAITSDTRAPHYDYSAADVRNRQLRIGYVKADFERDYGFKQQDSLTLLRLRELGYELVPIELPEHPPIGFILAAEAAAAFDELTRSGKDDLLVRQIRNAWPNVFREARFIPAVEYIQANRLRRQLIGEMQELFQTVDLYVHPSWASSSLRTTNYTGHPCLVLPNGFQDNGRPTSITFTGPFHSEATLTAVGQALQENTPWEEKHPEGF